LEIGKKFLRFITPGKAVNTSLDLSGYRIPAHSPTGAKGSIITKNTTAFGNRAIHIGTGETTIQADFLNAAAKAMLQIAVQRVEK
jgi:hypothetical protein